MRTRLCLLFAATLLGSSLGAGTASARAQTDRAVDDAPSVRSAIRENDFELAATLAERALEREPDSAELHLLLGDARFLSGDPEGSLAAYTSAVDHARDQDRVVVSAHYNHACALTRLGRTNDALNALERALSAGWSDLHAMRHDPDLAPLRSSEAFLRLTTLKPDWPLVGDEDNPIDPPSVLPVVLSFQRPGSPGDMIIRVEPVYKATRNLIYVSSSFRQGISGRVDETLSSSSLELLGCDWSGSVDDVLHHTMWTTDQGLSLRSVSLSGQTTERTLDAPGRVYSGLSAFLVPISAGLEAGKHGRFYIFSALREEINETAFEVLEQKVVTVDGTEHDVWEVEFSSSRGYSTRHWISDQAPYWFGSPGMSGWELVVWSTSES